MDLSQQVVPCRNFSLKQIKELELQGRELEENRYASDQKRRQLQEKVKELSDVFFSRKMGHKL